MKKIELFVHHAYQVFKEKSHLFEGLSVVDRYAKMRKDFYPIHLDKRKDHENTWLYALGNMQKDEMKLLNMTGEVL